MGMTARNAISTTVGSFGGTSEIWEATLRIRQFVANEDVGSRKDSNEDLLGFFDFGGWLKRGCRGVVNRPGYWGSTDGTDNISRLRDEDRCGERDG